MSIFFTPFRLPLSHIDVLNTSVAPLVNPSWDLVIHIKTMHAFTTPAALSVGARTYRRLTYQRSARLAEAIIINSNSLRREIDQHLEVDPQKIRLIPEAVDHDIFKPGDREAARASVASFGVTRPFGLFVSSLWRYKNCHGLLHAWKLARHELGGRQLVIVGAERDEHYAAELHLLVDELGLADDVVFVGGVPLEETVRFYQAADFLVYPSLNETFGLPSSRRWPAPARSSPPTSAPCPRPPAEPLCSPTPTTRRRSPVPSWTPPALRADTPPSSGSRAGSAVHLGRDRRSNPRRLSRSRRAATPSAMKILVTGGAGFIGSHTSDRLLELGHEVVVLDALTPPVHRGGPPDYLSPEVEFYEGDVRNEDLMRNLLRRVDAVYHFAAFQDYLPEFARFSEVNVVSTALLYQIIVEERLELERVVVASSQAAMGEGVYRCPLDGEQLPGMRSEAALAAGQWDIPCPDCGGPLDDAGDP